MAAEPAPSTPSSTHTLTSTSTITKVVMHGRGALVTRRVQPDPTELPAHTQVTVAVTHITERAMRQGIRVKIEDPTHHRLRAVRHERVLPDRAPQTHHGEEQVARIERELRKTRAHKAQVHARHTRLSGVTLMPARHRSWLEAGPIARIETSLEISELIQARQQRYDAKMLELGVEIARLERDLDRALVARDQQSSASPDSARVTTTVHVTLEALEAGSLPAFSITYLIREARWWPLYTLRLSQGGTQADLSMEAMVTQDSGEDWDEVHIALSTADLATDANLPELAALKLGKRQKPKPSGYRDAPDGLDRLFSAHDAFMTRRAQQGAPSPPPRAEPSRDVLGGMADRTMEELEEPAYEDDDDYGASSPLAAAPLPPPPAGFIAPSAPPMPRAESRSRGFGVPGITKKMKASFSQDVFERQAMAEPTRKQRALIDASAFEGGAGGGYHDSTIEHDDVFSPSHNWLDFAQLVLGDGSTSGKRGTLHRDQGRQATHGHIGRAEAAAVESELVDPRVTRGHYDHRYERPANIVTIPSDGVLHRIDVLRRQTEATLSWRSIPLEEEQVFRLAAIQNPFEAPMLTGPIDVFVEGSFLLSTRQNHVDVGAKLEVGLGVDERLRISRNVRTEEEQHGLLGGKTSVAHTITIELVSNLGFDAEVQVIDRVPITHDDDIHIRGLDHDPPAHTYDQDKRIEGGRQWRVKIAPGQKQVITSQYTIILSSKNELIGGNRRD